MTTIALETAPAARTPDEYRAEHIRNLVDAAPPLSSAQRARLAVLLSTRRAADKGDRA